MLNFFANSAAQMLFCRAHGSWKPHPHFTFIMVPLPLEGKHPTKP